MTVSFGEMSVRRHAFGDVSLSLMPAPSPCGAGRDGVRCFEAVSGRWVGGASVESFRSPESMEHLWREKGVNENYEKTRRTPLTNRHPERPQWDLAVLNFLWSSLLKVVG